MKVRRRGKLTNVRIVIADNLFKLIAAFPEPHSYLSATMGSTLAARRAGMQQAVRTTAIRINDSTMKVIRSASGGMHKKETHAPAAGRMQAPGVGDAGSFFDLPLAVTPRGQSWLEAAVILFPELPNPTRRFGSFPPQLSRKVFPYTNGED
jgi:hypothetical protein